MRLLFDGAFVGPMLPPGAPPRPAAPAPPSVSEAVLAIPLGTRRLVGQALDLLTRSDAGLRSASFYIGFLVLVTVAPVIMLFGLAISLEVPLFEPLESSSFDGPIILALFVALAGYTAAGIESRTLATAVIGGRAEGRPLRLRQSIALARRRFWRVLASSILVGLAAGVASLVIQLPISLALGNAAEIDYGLSLLVGTLVGAPFAYVPAGIVLGEVDAVEAIGRSIRLARARKRLAIVVSLFSILSQFIVLLGIGIGGDVVIRLADGTGFSDAFPAVLVVPLAAALTFAFGTLLFLVESITAAPAVYAFVALTHYTHGLEDGRDRPAPTRRLWDPWFTPGLAIAAALGLAALLAGVLGIPGG